MDDLNERDIIAQIREIFFAEATTLLQRFEDGVLSLETSAADAGVVEELFRAAHTVKGSAASVQFDDLSHYVHHVEDVLSKLKRREIEASPALVDLLLHALDGMRHYLDAARAQAPVRLDLEGLLGRVAIVLDGGDGHAPVAAAPAAPGPGDIIFAEDIDFLLAGLQSVASPNKGTLEGSPAQGAEGGAEGRGGAVGPGGTAGNGGAGATPGAASQGNDTKGAKARPAETISIAQAKIDVILNHFGEQVILQSELEHQLGRPDADREALARTLRQLTKITLMLQDSVLALRMVPVRPVFQKAARTVRDTSRGLGKDIEFTTVGEEIELDKTLADNLAGPVTHIIRNAIDHGIETPDARRAAGKPPRGKIEMRAAYNGGVFCLEISDDGKGLDRARILAKAQAQGIVPPGVDLSEEQVNELIFHPGFSTKDVATELSGRGFGMDIVLKEITELRGKVQIKSKPGAGTSFLVQLPLSVAIFNGLIVQVAGSLCILPNAEIREVLRLRDLRRIGLQGGHEAVESAGAVMPLVPVHDVLGFPDEGNRRDELVLVTRKGEKPFGLRVDGILGQQRVVMKNLGKELRNTQGLAGGAILADGNVAFVLKLGEIIDRFEKGAA